MPEADAYLLESPNKKWQRKSISRETNNENLI